MSKTVRVISAILVKLHMVSIGSNYHFTRKREFLSSLFSFYWSLDVSVHSAILKSLSSFLMTL